MPEVQEREKLQKPNREKMYVALIVAVVAMIAGMLFLYPRSGANTEPVSLASGGGDAAPAQPSVITREVEKIVEVEKEVTVEALQEGLNDMGILITQEYYFTDLISFSSIKKFLKTEIVLPFTESSYMVSYDGVVTAGIDLAAARVEKEDGQKRIVVHLPKASIQAVDIDLDSFELHEEKVGLGNHISVQDFNSSLQELEATAKRKAVDRGLLEKADETTRVVISHFVSSLVDPSVYSLEFTSV